jgi:hypothetical protein
VSWSLREPEEPPSCECKYDEARDEMNREDCPFHCDLVEGPTEHEAPLIQRKKPDSITANQKEDAA